MKAVQEVVWLAVVEMVSVAVCALVVVRLTGVVEPKLKVGRFTAPVGLVGLTAAASAMRPVNPVVGATVIADVFPVVAPAVTVTAAPEMLNVGPVRR